QDLSAPQREKLCYLLRHFSGRGAYHKIINRQLRGTQPGEVSPQPILGEAAPLRFTILENGIRFELSFEEGYSVGLFLDQRDNRRRLLAGYVSPSFSDFDASGLRSLGMHDGKGGNGPPTLLNTFAYTCGFSVCAAKAGLRTTN